MSACKAANATRLLANGSGGSAMGALLPEFLVVEPVEAMFNRGEK